MNERVNTVEGNKVINCQPASKCDKWPGMFYRVGDNLRTDLKDERTV